MTLREIDDALAAWNGRLGAAAQNLMDLEAEPSYQQITGSGGVPKAPITGVTASRVEPALGAMVTVFQHFSLLNETIKRAELLRHNLPTLFGSDQKLREIEELLRGNSIHLPAVDVPLEQRTLLSGVQNVECISPKDLLDTMVKAFQAAKDAVVAVDGAWNNLGATLNRTGARIGRLRARAAALGGGTPPDLDGAERTLQEMRARVQADPLGASADLDARIEPVLARVDAALEAGERLRQQIVNGLTAAHAQLDALAKLHHDSVVACAEVRIKVTGCGAPPSPQADETVEGLRQWLDRLEKKYAGGMLDPVAVGLRNWNSAAQDCVSKESAACAANRAPLLARDELRGRLDALKAKARAYGAAEDDALVELAKQAEALLYARPTPLDRAAAAVTGYERTLNGAKKRNDI
jgi:hypothetical protein